MNWAHLHLMLNHVPVLGTMFGLALLAWGLWRRNGSLERAALATFVIVALVAIPVYLTGEPAEEAVEHLAGTARGAIETHEEAATASFIGVELLGLVALGCLVLARTKWAVIALRSALALAITTAGLMVWTANLGGRIRHAELRQATVQTDAEHEGEGEDEAGEGR